VVEQNDNSHVLRQGCVIQFWVKLGRSGEEMLEMLQNAYGTEAMRQTIVF
jgi:hypothetical protein